MENKTIDTSKKQKLSLNVIQMQSTRIKHCPYLENYSLHYRVNEIQIQR